MTDIRHAFSEATAGFVDAVLAVPDDSWSAPGLGVWTLQELVGHASRAVVTVEQYLDDPLAARLLHARAAARDSGAARRRGGAGSPSRCRARR